MIHNEDNCPVYHPERMPEVIASFEKLEALGKELGVKQHYFTWCAPNHEAYVLLEADALSPVSRYLFSIPIRHNIKIVPVEPLSDTIDMARAVSAPGQG
jgi:hypothetical protein